MSDEQHGREFDDEFTAAQDGDYEPDDDALDDDLRPIDEDDDVEFPDEERPVITDEDEDDTDDDEG